MLTEVKPWEMGSESKEFNSFEIPEFCRARYILLDIRPPKNKTIRDGLVATYGLISYFTPTNEEVEMIDLTETGGIYTVTFPKGKKGVTAVKYRGPKSFYKFKNEVTGKYYEIPQSKFTLEAAEQYLNETLKGYSSYGPEESAEAADEYFESMYMFGLAKDMGLDPEENPTEIPKLGMVSQFYRYYSAPKGDDKYGDTKILKYSKSKEYPNLPKEYEIVPAELATLIYNKLKERDDTFNPDTF
jgi:hypothetical protein